jgi:hypothetical protein
MFDIYLILPYYRYASVILRKAEMHEPARYARTDAGELMNERGPIRTFVQNEWKGNSLGQEEWFSDDQTTRENPKATSGRHGL